jgi:hypothetical protein
MESDNDSLCLSNFESDINAVIRGNTNRKISTFRTLHFGGMTTNDEGGGAITMNDQSSSSDQENDYNRFLCALNKPKEGQESKIETARTDEVNGMKK